MAAEPLVVYDLMLTEEADLTVDDGDLVLGDSRSLDIQLIVLTAQGEWRAHLLCGCNVERFVNATRPTDKDYRPTVRTQLQADGLSDVRFTEAPGGWPVTATRTRNGPIN